MPNNIVLVGPMGAGKSTIGRLLAAKLGYKFLDTDHLIEDRTGADIPWIFDVEGEEGFRQRESAVLSEVIQLGNVVIATGGGIVLKDRNREALKIAGHVIYLTASIQQLTQRTQKDKKRPLLQVDDPKKKIIQLFEQRDPLYRSVATDILITDGYNPKTVVQKIVEMLDSQ